MTDQLKSFVPEIVPHHNLNRMYYNEEEYSVFNNEVFRFPVIDEDEKIWAVRLLLQFLGEDKKVVIYVKHERDVSKLASKLAEIIPDETISVVQARDKNQINNGGSYRVLITSYRVPLFDQSKVIATIFFDIPIRFHDEDDGNELYYRLATRAGAYCEQGIGAVFHLVSPIDEDRMNEIENYFGRMAKEQLPVTCYEGYVGLVDVLSEANVIDDTLATTLRREARNGTVQTSNFLCEDRMQMRI